MPVWYHASDTQLVNLEHVQLITFHDGPLTALEDDKSPPRLMLWLAESYGIPVYGEDAINLWTFLNKRAALPGQHTSTRQPDHWSSP